MGWYQVVKTVKGHRYAYWQTSWREGARVRTYSIYVGPVSGGWGRAPAGARSPPAGSHGAGKANRVGGGPPVAPLTWPRPERFENLHTEGEAEFVASLFSPARGGAWSMPWRKTLRRETERPVDDCGAEPEGWVSAIPATIGVRCWSRPWSKMNEKDGAVYSRFDDAIQLPSWTRFPSPASYYATVLHETAHATYMAGRSERPVGNEWEYSEKLRAREELVAELTAMKVMRRLGLGVEQVEANAAKYLQMWEARLGGAVDRANGRRYAELESERAADFIISRARAAAETAHGAVRNCTELETVV